MAKIPALNHDYQGLDVQSLARTWIRDRDGDQRRMGGRAEAVKNISEALNDLFVIPREIFCGVAAGLPLSYDHTIDGNVTAYHWMYLDDHPTNRAYDVHIIAQAGYSNANHGYAMMPGANYYDSGIHTPYTDTNIMETDAQLLYSHYDVNRGGMGYVIDGINKVSHPQSPLITVMDRVTWELDTESDIWWVAPVPAKPGSFVTDTAIEDIRATLHERRQKGLPIVLNWSAYGKGSDTDTWPGDGTGLATNAIVPRNLFDYNCTSRSANSPGFMFSGFKCGISDNSSVPVRCFAYGSTNGGNAWVMFEGPNHISPNHTNIMIVSGQANTWYGNSDHVVYLSTDSPRNNVNELNANKIDIFGWMGSDEGNALRIFGLNGHLTYG